MRRIFVNHVRPKHAAKRPFSQRRVDQEEVALLSSEPYEDILALDRTLDRLSKVDPRLERIVDLRYFGGLASQKAVESSGVSIVTVKRNCAVAKAWFHGELANRAAAP